MVRKVLQIGEPILNVVCDKVTDFNSPKTQQVVQDLLDSAESQRKITAGLAAPQIGEKLAICVCRRVDLEDKNEYELTKSKLWEVMINPEIIYESKDQSLFWEACLSIGEGEKQLFGPVARPETVKINYFDAKGKEKQITASDFFSHEIQHEIDHLHGILFLKYVASPTNIWTKANIDKYFDKNNEYPPVE